MKGVWYLPARVGLSEARRSIHRLDWPGCTACDADAFSAERRWVPFDTRSRVILVDPDEHPDLIRLRLGRIPMQASRPGPPPGHNGAVLAPTRCDHVVFIPVWLLRAPDAAGGWAAVSAFDGSLAGGDLAAEPRAAVWRLVFLLALAITACMAGGVVTYFLLSHAVFEGLAGAIGVKAAILVTAIVLLTWRLRAALPRLLVEPSRRVMTGRIQIPLSRSWLGLLRSAGLAFLMVFALEVYLLVSLAHESFPVFRDSVFFFCVARAFWAALFAGLALAMSRGRWLPAGPAAATDRVAAFPAGRLPDLVWACLHVTLLAMAGMMVGHLLIRTIPMVDFPREIIPPASLMIWGAQGGAILALHVSRLPGGARGPLSVGLVAEALGKLLVGPGLAIVLMPVFVFAAERVGYARGKHGRPASPSWQSLRAAWGFTVGALVGRLAGRFLGTFVFGFFGVGGVVAGEVLGLLFGATAGYMSQRAAYRDSIELPVMLRQTGADTSAALR